MPKCLDCNNTIKFYVPVYGYQIFYYKNNKLNDIVQEYLEVDPEAPIKCGECESVNLEGEL
jgi:hypothetical protein